jgi:2-dehydro-3-deoxygalactonokinase
MANYITIDGGTTNTRVSLVCNNTILATKKMSIGAGKKDIVSLKNAIKTAIKEILSENSLGEKDIKRILASGMITSEYGLCNLPHITAPASIEELHNEMYETVIEDVSEIPFVFMRGIKTEGTDLDESDMMRGEETELMGLLKTHRDACLYVLPGSHSKHISVDSNGRIVALRTMMTGELFAAVMQHTILRDATSFEHNEICVPDLFNGFYYAKKRGNNEALFKTRILKTMFNGTPEQCYSFLLGSVLCDEVEAILQANEKTVVLGGQKQLRMALATLLEKVSDKKIVVLSDSEVECSTSLGAIQIFEF